jgi:uroporphyrinogen-III decarboxylase
MNAKARMRAALAGRSVSRRSAHQLAVAPLYLHLFLAAEVRRQALDGYRALLGDRRKVPLEPEDEVAIQARAIQVAWESLGETPDWIWTQLLPPAAWLANCAVLREGEEIWRLHQPSGAVEELSLLYPPNDSSAGVWQVSPPSSKPEVEALIPAPSARALLADGSLALVRRLVETMGQQTFVHGKMGAPFWRCYANLGFQGLMTMPLDQPQLMHQILERHTQAALALARAYAAAGVHGVFVEECLTSADLLSPGVYDEFVFPYDQRLLAEFRALDLPVILYICGDVVPRLSHLVELSPAALAVEESKKGFRLDLAQIAVAVGSEMAVLGNLDATRVKEWDGEALMRELRAQATAARPARGFIVSMGSPFPLDTPREKVASLITTARSAELAALWQGPGD